MRVRGALAAVMVVVGFTGVGLGSGPALADPEPPPPLDEVFAAILGNQTVLFLIMLEMYFVMGHISKSEKSP